MWAYFDIQIGGYTFQDFKVTKELDFTLCTGAVALTFGGAGKLQEDKNLKEQ